MNAVGLTLLAGLARLEEIAQGPDLRRSTTLPSFQYLTSLVRYDIIYIVMRTTINVDDDVLELARALAAARQISLGAAVSYLVRRGASARMPHRIRNGFHTFAIEPGLMRFGPDDMREVLDEEDSSSAPLFSKQE